MRTHGVDAYRAVATSAVRDAANGDVLVERAEREAGIKLDVIEGVEEARLVRVAVTHAVPIGSRKALLIDIGGGSVELTLLAGDSARESVSLPMGTVRLTEAFLDREDPVTPERRALLREYIDRLLHEARFLVGLAPDVTIATGGNADAIAQLAPTRTQDGHGIDVAKMRSVNDALCKLSVRERRDTFELRGDRADVIVPAIFVLDQIASVLGETKIATPGVGLKEGIIGELIERAFRVWDEGARRPQSKRKSGPRAQVPLRRSACDPCCGPLGDAVRRTERHARAWRGRASCGCGSAQSCMTSEIS